MRLMVYIKKNLFGLIKFKWLPSKITLFCWLTCDNKIITLNNQAKKLKDVIFVVQWILVYSVTETQNQWINSC